jgi:hypothetical protein
VALALTAGLPWLLSGAGEPEKPAPRGVAPRTEPGLQLAQRAPPSRQPAPRPQEREREPDSTRPADRDGLTGDLLPVPPAQPPRRLPNDLADTNPDGPPPIVVLIPPTTREKDDPGLLPPLLSGKPAPVTVAAPKPPAPDWLVLPVPNGLGTPPLLIPAGPKGNGPPPLMPADPKGKGPLIVKAGLPPAPVVGPAAKGMAQDVRFMGAAARGQRICIIMDRSGSMKGAPIAALKAELFKTLMSLRPEVEFFLIFFNSDPMPQPIPTWLRGGAGVPLVAPFIQMMPAEGLTNPAAGFNIAFRLNPRPDVIFFMTDGQVTVGTTQETVKFILAMNSQGPPIPIHSILFSHSGNMARSPKQAKEMEIAAAFLRHIAFHSGGTFSAVALPPQPLPALGPTRPPVAPPILPRKK